MVPVMNRLYAFAFTDFACYRRCKRVLRRFAKVLHALAQMLLADDIEQRRLLELNGESLVERGVEDRVTGVIDEIRQDDRVLHRHGGGAAELADPSDAGVAC